MRLHVCELDTCMLCVVLCIRVVRRIRVALRIRVVRRSQTVGVGRRLWEAIMQVDGSSAAQKQNAGTQQRECSGKRLWLSQLRLVISLKQLPIAEGTVCSKCTQCSRQPGHISSNAASRKNCHQADLPGLHAMPCHVKPGSMIPSDAMPCHAHL